MKDKKRKDEKDETVVLDSVEDAEEEEGGNVVKEEAGYDPSVGIRTVNPKEEGQVRSAEPVAPALTDPRERDASHQSVFLDELQARKKAADKLTADLAAERLKEKDDAEESEED